METTFEQAIIENGEVVKTLRFTYDDNGEQIKKERIMPNGDIFEIYEVPGGIVEYKTFPIEETPIKIPTIQELLDRIAILESKLDT